MLVFKEMILHVSKFLEESDDDIDRQMSNKVGPLGEAMRRSVFIIVLETAVHCLSLDISQNKFL